MSKKKIEYIWDPQVGKLESVEVEQELSFEIPEKNLVLPSYASNTPRISIQWGSGKPGENGSEVIERRLFEKLMFHNPKIVFAPFHGIVGHENDWTRFLNIYQPLTSHPIQLIELNPGKPPKNLKKFYAPFEEADLIVLGSGVVEPYMELLHLLQFGQKLFQWQKSGKVIYGYSAGTIAIGEVYLHYFLGHEVLMHLFLAEQNSAKMAKALRKELEEHMDAESLEELDSLMIEVRKSGLHPSIQSPFCRKPLGLMQAETFCLVPKVVVLPHYGEYFLCTEDHLRTMTEKHPQWKNIGIPNGMALIHRIENDTVTTEVFGHNHRIPVTMIGQNGEKLEFREGDQIPL